MSAEVLATVKSPEFRNKLQPTGIEPAPLSLQDYIKFLASERERLGVIAKRAKMQAD
jgi:tripartite-type tricarboxylate transporter receptor subunit TctC